MRSRRVVVGTFLGFVLKVLGAGCTPPPVSGSGILLNVQPGPPAFASSYDFEILEAVVGRACVRRFEEGGTVYWVAVAGLDKVSGDAATNRAIGEAAFKAVGSIDKADTLLLTKVVSEGDDDKVCATVYGRAVEVRKAVDDRERPQPAKQGSPQKDDDEDDEDEGREAGSKPPPTGYGDPSASVSVDREMILSGVGSVMPQVMKCSSKGHGQVIITFTIAPDGQVTSTALKTPSGDLGKCVADAFKAATFAKTQSGGTFTLPFTL